jgi:hypothetical protein
VELVFSLTHLDQKTAATRRVRLSRRTGGQIIAWIAEYNRMAKPVVWAYEAKPVKVA